MIAHSATGPTTPPTIARQALAWAITWILPLFLGTAVVFAYLYMIVPPTDRPWYRPPPPKPGKSVIFRSLNHLHRVSDQAQAKAERKAKLEERRSAAISRGSAGPAGGPKSAVDDAEPGLDPTGAEATGAEATVTGHAFASPRSRAELDTLWKEYGDTPFDSEPLDEGWAQAHRSLYYQLFALTRDATFDGAPDSPVVSLREATCRSIRCELVLASTYHHELTLLADSLAELRLKRASLWRSFDRSAVQSQPAPSGDGTVYELRLVIAFASDLADLTAVSLGKRKILAQSPMGSVGSMGGPMGPMGPMGPTHD